MTMLETFGPSLAEWNQPCFTPVCYRKSVAKSSSCTSPRHTASGPPGALCQATSVWIPLIVVLGTTLLPAPPPPRKQLIFILCLSSWYLCSPGPTWEQCTADHAWHDDQAHGQHLEVAGQDGACLGVVQVPGRQRPLHDDLGAQGGSESQWQDLPGGAPGRGLGCCPTSARPA